MIKKIKNLPYPILGGAIGLGMATVILNIGFFRKDTQSKSCWQVLQSQSDQKADWSGASQC